MPPVGVPRIVGEFSRLSERNRNHLRLYTQRSNIMFETAVQEKRTGIPWGIIMGVAALAGLLGAGYMLIT